MSKSEIAIFPTIHEIAEKIIEDFQQMVFKHADQSSKIHIALSGGNTPKTIYQMMARSLAEERLPWSIIHFYWGDERCVAGHHPDSNYGMVYNTLLKYIPIPPENIHRISGENDPLKETKRYADLLLKNIDTKIDHIPQFTWILLGLGEDGHTASLFPDQQIIKEKNSICACTKNPVKGYQRITFTYPLINQASRITFLVSGDSKSAILARIIGERRPRHNYPASKIDPLYGKLQWYIDSAAANELKKE